MSLSRVRTFSLVEFPVHPVFAEDRKKKETPHKQVSQQLTSQVTADVDTEVAMDVTTEVKRLLNSGRR